MPKKIKVALLTHAGGAHVEAYLQALAASEACSEVVLGDPDGKWEDAAKRVLGGKLKRVSRDLKSLLAEERPEMALVTMEAILAPPVIDAALDAITVSLRQSDPVVLVGFGTFTVKERAARTGRNPQTGATIEIKAARVPGFKAGKALKDALN